MTSDRYSAMVCPVPMKPYLSEFLYPSGYWRTQQGTPETASPSRRKAANKICGMEGISGNAEGDALSLATGSIVTSFTRANRITLGVWEEPLTILTLRLPEAKSYSDILQNGEEKVKKRK